jgi:hypothetical protein
MASELDPTSLRERLAEMETREQRLMELLKTTQPERLEHDLRNVLNELSLLRTMFDRMDDVSEPGGHL